MRLRRFFVPTPLGTDTGSTLFTLTSQGPLVNQLKNVFRLGKGDQVVLFDNSGYDYVVAIESYEKDTVSFSKISGTRNTTLPTRETYLFSSIVKKDNFEWISQKATELGVSYIVPIISERSEKKDLNLERIQKIVIEAAEQSGRGTLPILEPIVDLKEALEKYAHIKSLAWHPESPKFVSQDVENAIGAYVGPEGGWSPEELSLFKKHGVHMHSLGPQILRSETAVIAVLSRLVF